MATKVALTAEEFRENSQRSIALFNTEKLSTNSTHVLKSAYCNSVHFCRCNLHGACGGKALMVGVDVLTILLQSARSVWRQRRTGIAFASTQRLQSARSVWRQRKTQKSFALTRWVAICTERVEAKPVVGDQIADAMRVAICTERVEAKRYIAVQYLRAKTLQSARSVWRQRARALPTTRTRTLQSARSVWRQSVACADVDAACRRCNLHGACGGKVPAIRSVPRCSRCNLHGACGGKGGGRASLHRACTCCNLHGACGGKADGVGVVGYIV